MSATAFQRRRRELAAEAAETIEVENVESEIDVEASEIEPEAEEATASEIEPEAEEATEEKPKKGRRKGGEA